MVKNAKNKFFLYHILTLPTGGLHSAQLPPDRAAHRTRLAASYPKCAQKLCARQKTTVCKNADGYLHLI